MRARKRTIGTQNVTVRPLASRHDGCLETHRFQSANPEINREAHLSTQQARAQASPRLPCAHGDSQRPQDHRCPPRRRPSAPVGLIKRAHGVGPYWIDPPWIVLAAGAPALDRLRKRRNFLAAAKARRAGVGCCLMQGRDRGDAGEIRVGFTVTKKIGNSVVRNRIRRRLREAVRHVMPEGARPGHDYVLVARHQALSAPFDELVRDLGRALRKLHAPEAPASSNGSGSSARSSASSQAGRSSSRARSQRASHSSAAPEAAVVVGQALAGCTTSRDTQSAVCNAAVTLLSEKSAGDLRVHGPHESQTIESQAHSLSASSGMSVPENARFEPPTAADGGNPA